MKSKDRMIRAIRNRKDLEPVRISLKKLLEKGDMGNYLNLCSDRLAEELKIDGEDTQINFVDFPDILFTPDGFFDCRHVLENYLPFDMLSDTWQLLIEAEQENREINRMAADFCTFQSKRRQREKYIKCADCAEVRTKKSFATR